MAIYKVYSYETRDVQIEYTVEADSEGDAINQVKRLSEMRESEAEQYIREGPIREVEFEEMGDAPSRQEIVSVGFWGTR